MNAHKLNSLLLAAALMGGLYFAGPAFATPACDGTNANPGSCHEVDPAGLNDTIAGATFVGFLGLTALVPPTFPVLQVDGAILDRGDCLTIPAACDVDIF